MGFRFQKRISILPGVRINLSKSGASASVGPRGADVNIGKDGITTNAGIPGTGLSYRQKVGGGKGIWLAVLVVIGGLAVWAFRHWSNIEKAIASARPIPSLSTGSFTDSSTEPSTVLSPGSSTQISTAPQNAESAARANGNMTRFVRRQEAILREEPKTSGHILKREMKGAAVTLVSESADGWSKVTDGNVTGYMRSSVLGTEPPD